MQKQLIIVVMDFAHCLYLVAIASFNLLHMLNNCLLYKTELAETKRCYTQAGADNCWGIWTPTPTCTLCCVVAGSSCFKPEKKMNVFYGMYFLLSV